MSTNIEYCIEYCTDVTNKCQHIILSLSLFISVCLTKKAYIVVHFGE